MTSVLCGPCFESFFDRNKCFKISMSVSIAQYGSVVCVYYEVETNKVHDMVLFQKCSDGEHEQPCFLFLFHHRRREVVESVSVCVSCCGWWRSRFLSLLFVSVRVFHWIRAKHMTQHRRQ